MAIKLSRYKKASEYEVKDWFHKNLPELSPYQKSKLDSEFFRDTPYRFFKWEEESKTSLWWRMTLPLWPIYAFLAIIFVTFRWMFTGKSGLPRKWLDNYHYPWAKKLDI